MYNINIILGFLSDEICYLLTSEVLIPNLFPRIKIQKLYDSYIGPYNKPTLLLGDIITGDLPKNKYFKLKTNSGLQYKADETEDMYESITDCHCVSYLETVSNSEIVCRDSAYNSLKRCFWTMPAKREKPTTFVITEVERVTQL